MSDKKTWLKPDQVNEMRDACLTDNFIASQRDRNDAIIALMYDAGLRPGELTNVTVEMFDRDAGVLRLPPSAQKQYATGGSPPPASIQLADDEFTRDTTRTLNSYLNSRDSDSKFMFPSKKREAMKTRSLRHMIDKVAKVSGVEPYVAFEGRGDPADIDPYTFRHSVAYRMLNARGDGTTLNDVKRRLRHAKISTTENNYEHFNTV